MMSVGKGGRYGLCGLGLLVALGVGVAPASNPNEREVKREANVQDSDKIHSPENPDSKLWVLDFKFKDPRIIKVDVPGRGQRVCLYLWYQVSNPSRTEARTLIPDFELVTHDKNTVHHDQVLPKVQDAIRRIEDPTDFLKIKNSVTISAEPIPPTRENAVPRTVTGVAIWDDVNPDSNRYSIFVSGLSNGWSVTDPLEPGGKQVVRRKTLQLNFERLGDRYYQKSEEIHFVPPAQWIYRGSTLTVPGLPPTPAPPKKEN
jgi:hypothetical protein